MTIEKLRELAEKAKAWWPLRSLFCRKISPPMGECRCEGCLGAKRAVEDVAKCIDAVERDGFDSAAMRAYSQGWANDAARIASYFAAEPNDVSRFRDAVVEMCK